MFELFRTRMLSEYGTVLLFVGLAVGLAAILVGASYFFARQNPESEKLSAYECGFEPYGDARSTFDINFSLIAVLFLIFDIEVMFIMPWCSMVLKTDLVSYWVMLDFIFELSVGYFYAWQSKAFYFE